jgi:hypothetical protein
VLEALLLPQQSGRLGQMHCVVACIVEHGGCGRERAIVMFLDIENVVTLYWNSCGAT